MLKKSSLYFLSLFSILTSCQNPSTTTAVLSGKYTGFNEPLTFYVRDHGKELSFGIPVHIDTLVTTADGSFSLVVDAKHS